MSKWEIRYWDEEIGKKSIERWLEKLTLEQFKSVAKELAIVELIGNNLRMPHSKALGGGLFELRERKYGYRIYYTFKSKQVIIILAAGDKKSQESDMKIAKARLLKI